MGHSAGAVMTGSEHVIDVVGLGVGAAAERLISTASEAGFTVVAVGPTRFRVARVRRPKWATVVAVLTAIVVGLGLLFLLIKTTESADVSIIEDRTGIRLRIHGVLPRELVEALRQSLDGGGTEHSFAPVAAPVVAAPYRPSLSPAGGPWLLDPASPPPAPVGAGPWTSTVGAGSVAATVPRSSLQALPPPVPHHAARPLVEPPAPQTTVLFVDGTRIPVEAGLVIGRAPSPDPSLPNARLHPVNDPSLSKTHLSLGPLERGVWVMDHDSTNGTSVVWGGVAQLCAPGVRVEVPLGAQVLAGELSITVSGR